jgi:hypothetical protein
MGHEKELVSLNFAPRTSIAVAQLEEIDGAVELCPPLEALDLLHFWVDLHEGSWPQHGVESKVLQPDVTIQTVPDVEVLNQGNWDLAPHFHHPREKVCLVKAESPIEPHREGNWPITVVHL